MSHIAPGYANTLEIRERKIAAQKPPFYPFFFYSLLYMHNTNLNFCHFSWNPRICFLCRRVLIGRTFWAYEGLRGNKFISNILYKNVSITKNLHIFFFRSPITFTKFSLTVKIPILNYVEMVLRMRTFIFLTKTFASVNDSKVWKPSCLLDIFWKIYYFISP